MRLDALESSHPISVLVNHPDEIGELFDDISYKKGERHNSFKFTLILRLNVDM